MFFEPHPNIFQPTTIDVSSSPIVFRWDETLTLLQAADDDVTGMSDRQVELDATTLPTISLHMQRFSPGRGTRTMQTTANSLFAVAQGSGRSVVGDNVMEWRFGDVIAVPAWRPYRHEATSAAVLLRVTDRPVFQRFGWLREIVN
jgi:gentisate 1,2-dioxygenase